MGECWEATKLGEVAEWKRERHRVIPLGSGEPADEPEGVTAPVLVSNSSV